MAWAHGQRSWEGRQRWACRQWRRRRRGLGAAVCRLAVCMSTPEASAGQQECTRPPQRATEPATNPGRAAGRRRALFAPSTGPHLHPEDLPRLCARQFHLGRAALDRHASGPLPRSKKPRMGANDAAASAIGLRAGSACRTDMGRLSWRSLRPRFILDRFSLLLGCSGSPAQAHGATPPVLPVLLAKPRCWASGYAETFRRLISSRPRW